MGAFQKAVKHDAKLRMAVCGPAGSGKTYTLLSIATELGGPIAYVDTEHGSASKYADLFAFDVIEPDVFDPRDLIKLIGEAIESGYRVVCIDSLSHYWMGKGGELDMVDSAAKRSQSGNSFTAWKNVTPIHNELVDTIISAPIHVLVSMRTKTEWVIEKDDRGKSAPRKVGLAPVMRDGIEFEFDVCGDMDQDNTLTVTKSRCPELSGAVINRPGKGVAATLKKWLSGSLRPAPPAPPTPPALPPVQPIKPAAPAPMAAPQPQQPEAPEEVTAMWFEMKSIAATCEVFAKLKAELVTLLGPGGEAEYYRILATYGNGAKHANDLKSSQRAARNCAWKLWDALQQAKSLQITDEDLPPALRGEVA